MAALNGGTKGIKRKSEDLFDIDPISEDEETEPVSKKDRVVAHRLCPYLDTINRQVLDFDFEKLCSVSLSRINVYACLVCGKYFQGRGTNTHAYTHSVAESHHVFLNLHTLKFYCLPDNYEIVDSSLDDIKYVLNPTFTSDHIKQLDVTDKLSRAIDGTLYLPGIVGLNNIKANDYCNVILQALSHVTPLRDFFLREINYARVKRPPGDSSFLLVQRFGELMRKLWNPRNFKAHVSPHEMLQAVVLWSRKKFQFTKQGDPIDFLSWFLNALHLALNGTKNPDSSIIYKTFLGAMRIRTRKIPPVELEEKQRSELLLTEEYQERITDSPFLYLTCDLPPPPLFKDEIMENIIPQVNLYNLLTKFNGETEKEYKTYKENFLKKFEITRLPPYLILYIKVSNRQDQWTFEEIFQTSRDGAYLNSYISEGKLLKGVQLITEKCRESVVKRFTKNTFFVEKNPTIVNFPVKNIDFGDFLMPEIKATHKSTVYDLVANIVHDGEPDKGTYRVHLLHKGNGKWYEMQDLHVTDILPQMITLTEAYIQIYELKKESS